MTDADIADQARAQAGLSAAERLQVGACIEPGCGAAIYRNPMGGAIAKRCIECRRLRGGVAGKRGPRASDHRARAAGVEDGPVVSVRRLMSGLSCDVRPGGVALHVQCAAAALTGATGIPEYAGRHIIEAMQVLIEQGESGEQIRRRLNPNPFGRLAAGRRPHALQDYLDEGTSL